MNILYYVPNISRTWGGIYQYALSLLKSLVEDKINYNHYFVYILDENEDYDNLTKAHKNIHIIYSKDKPKIKEPFLAKETEPFSIVTPHLIKINKQALWAIRFFVNRYNRKVIQKYKTQGYKETLYLNWLIKKNSINLIHCPYQVIYNMEDIPCITTMHDVQELYFPQFFSSTERAYRAVYYKEYIEKASAVVVSYSHVKQDIVKFFAKPKEQVHVCLLDMKELWFDRFSKKDILDISQYNIPDIYILYPAATWEHKNHVRLLEAIAYLNYELKCSIHLICTGHQNEYYHAEIENKIIALNLENKVTFLGVVPDQLLFSLYHKAAGVVIPTLYEAGSFPLMESILLNIPVICSNITSLPETIQNTKFTFDPFDYKKIAEKLYLLLTDKNFIQENLQNNAIQAVRLRNNNVSEKINEVYRLISKKEILY